MVRKGYVHGYDSNFASTRKEILKKRMREVSDNKKISQFAVFRNLKIREKDGCINVIHQVNVNLKHWPS